MEYSHDDDDEHELEHDEPVAGPSTSHLPPLASPQSAKAKAGDKGDKTKRGQIASDLPSSEQPRGIRKRRKDKDGADGKVEKQEHHLEVDHDDGLLLDPSLRADTSPSTSSSIASLMAPPPIQAHDHSRHFSSHTLPSYPPLAPPPNPLAPYSFPSAATAGSYRPQTAPPSIPTPTVSSLRETNGRGEVDRYGDEGILPPLELVLEGCEAWFNGYFQLSFLHRPSFLHKLSIQSPTDPVSPFLILAILTVSARFTPSLIDRYGGTTEAVEVLSGRAHRLLAEMLKLGSEKAGPNATETEVRRRTWWFLTLTSNSLNVSTNTPTILDPLSCGIPLPSTEDDFSFGTLTTPPTYFPGNPLSQPPPSGSSPRISLLGALLTIFAIWGRTSRALCGMLSGEPELTKVAPWRNESLLETSMKSLNGWLGMLSNKQKWSTANLLAYKNVNQDLSLFSIFLAFHLNHMALRRQYLPIMLNALHPYHSEQDAEFQGQMPPGGKQYWAAMANTMLTHAFDAIELQEVVKKVRVIQLGGSPYMAFCLYLSGTILNYLRCCPWLAPSLAPKAAAAVASALETLSDIVKIWPMTERWYHTLLSQASIPPVDSSNRHHVTEQAHKDLHLDKSIGMFRQFAESSEPGRGGASPESQYAAASALAGMGNSPMGGGLTPREAGPPPPVIQPHPLAMGMSGADLDKTFGSGATSSAGGRSPSGEAGVGGMMFGGAGGGLSFGQHLPFPPSSAPSPMDVSGMWDFFEGSGNGGGGADPFQVDLSSLLQGSFEFDYPDSL
ncbi:hypothetical protein MNV49_002250 [Pseudohyphozyma bogoriensis]|nr:hypothetical protein MNV49_002250 [Pseudohyphozyma bogoriensis]